MNKKIVSVIKERAKGECRVILTPKEVEQFFRKGFTVLVEQGAGIKAGHDDTSYSDVGAQIVSQKQAWSSNFVLKYKPPLPDEWKWLRPDMHLCAIFHAEGDPGLVTALVRSGVTAYSYEFFQKENGDFPLAIPGGEIAGKMAVLYGAYHLQRHLGGSGVLLTETKGASKAKVTIIGYGNVGSASARLALAMGAEVVVLGRSGEGLKRFELNLGGNIRTAICSEQVLQRELSDTDLLIGAILISTYDTKPIVHDDLVKLMPKGSMIVDVTCGYGSGYMPSFDQETSFEDPVYEKYGVLHCKIDKLPAQFPITTTEAYSANALPYLLRLAEMVYEGTFDSISSTGKIVSQGKITHPVIQKHMDHYRKQSISF
ncbi:NAD(P)-dependent oxidoreductase [Pseudoalteromonas galatheae]|uniref:NAD(P)-dependent oxidoreductase n=1 Tax=Pseudoalteromonas galatheae TaxID=579562 RepID=UPI001432C178|nr:NAD(P)-dependent oxidoreductase [Pseudoalteromonas galatheae]